MKIRFTLSQILITVLFVALTLTLVVNHTQSQRKIQSLRRKLDLSRDHLHTVEYGNATLRLLERNPAIPDNADCLRFLHHELAYSVFLHWESESAIDEAVDTPGYAKLFAARALPALGCESTDEFIELSTTTLWVYTGDALHAAAAGMSDTRLAALDTFLQAARELDQQGG